MANDVWKALYSGRYLAYFGQFPHHSAFTYAPVVEFLPRDSFNWIGNLIFFGFETGLGITGVHLLRVAVGVLSLLLMHSLVDFRKHPLVLLLLVGLAYGLYQKLLLRTAIFSIPGLVGTYWLWDRVNYRGIMPWLYGFPVVFLLWSNLHGSYVVGLILLTSCIVGEGINQATSRTESTDWRYFLKLIAVGGLCFFVTTYVHPYPTYTALDLAGGLLDRFLSAALHAGEILAGGEIATTTTVQSTLTLDTITTVKGLRSLFQGMILPKESLLAREFQFTLDHLLVLYVRVAILYFILGFLAFSMGGRPFNFDLFLPFLASSYLGLAYVRGTAYIPITVTGVVLVYTRRHRFPRLGGKRWKWLAGIGLICVLVGPIGSSFLRGSLPDFLGTRTQEIGFSKADRFSSELPLRARQQYPRERFFNTFNIGAYLIWTWWPKKRVMIDSKTSAYRRSYVQSYADGDISLLQRFDLRHAILPEASTWNRDFLAVSPAWEPELSDRGIILYHRSEPYEF